MAPRTTARRSAGALLAGLLLAGTLATADAGAQSGNGLYEPFPEAAVKERAQKYLERLGERSPDAGLGIADDELEDGVFVGSLREAPRLEPAGPQSGMASGRAGGGGGDAALGIQLLLLAAALALPVVALASRGRLRAG